MPNIFENIFNTVSKATEDIPVPKITPRAEPDRTSQAYLDEQARFSNSPAGIAVNTLGAIPEATGDVLKNILQTTARSVGTVGITAGNIFSNLALKYNVFPSEIPTNQNKFTDILFGGQPIRDIQGAGQNAVQQANELASSIAGRPITPVGSSAGLPLAFAGILMDLSGFGGKAGVKTLNEIPEAFFRNVAKETNPGVIENTLKKIGLDETNARALSKEFAPTKTVQEAKDVLARFGQQSDNQFSNILSPRETPTTAITKTPRTPEEAADIYYREKIVPTRQSSGADVIGADDMKDYFGKDYSDANHPTYSKAAFSLYEKSLAENPSPNVILTGGGPASGKTELVTKNLLRAGFNGTVYDSNLSNYEGAVKQIEMARKAGKNVQIHGILPDIEKSRTFSIIRENQTGRGISDATFARGHAGFPTVALKLLEEGIIKPEDMKILDTREVTSWDEAITKAFNGDYIKDPLEVLKKLGYNEEYVRQQYSKEKYDVTTGKRRDQIPVRSGSSDTSPQNRSDQGNANRGADGSRVGEAQGPERNTVRAVETALERAKNFKEGESFGPRNVKMSSEGIPLALSRRERALIEGKSKIVDKFKAIPESIRRPSSLLDTATGEGRSLEILANQGREVLSGEPFPVDVSLPNIIEKTVTPVKNKVNIIDTYLRTPEAVMKKIGFEKEQKLLRDAMDEYWKELPKNIEKIDQWQKKVPSKESNLAIFKWLDGDAITLGPKEYEVALEIKDWLKEWAKRLKLPADGKISHYITHIFNREIIAKEFDEELAKVISDKIPSGVYDPFLLERIGRKGYKQDTWLALEAYVKRGTRKVHIDPALDAIQTKAGVQLEFSNIEKSQFKYIQRYIENVNMRPGEKEEALDNFLKSIIGYRLGQRPTNSLLRFFRQATFRGMLGLNPASAIRNLSQGVNTYATLGEKYTILGYLGLFKKGSGEELLREGILNAGFVEDRVLSAGKKIMQGMDKVLFAAFSTAERINRGAAYFGAKAKALSEGKSQEEAIRYAKSIVRKTQFSFDSVDTPVGMSSTLAKTLLQFQSYTTKQIEFLGGMAKGSFRGQEKIRNLTGLIRYALAGLAFTYTIGKAFGMKPEELLPWYRFDVPPSLKLPVEAIKALLDAPDKYGNNRDVEQKLTDVGKASIGLVPGGSQIKKTTEGIQSIQEGGSFGPSGSFQFRQGQSIAEKVQTALFGKYSSRAAQQFFDRKKIKEKEEEPIKKIYNQVQELVDQGREDEAQEIVDKLPDDQYEIYKTIRSNEKRKDTLKAEKQMFKTVIKIQDLVDAGNEDEAQAIIDDMTDEEYRIYKLAKEKID